MLASVIYRSVLSAARALWVSIILAWCVSATVRGGEQAGTVKRVKLSRTLEHRTRAGRETTELAKAINQGDEQKVKELIALRPACVNEWESGLPPLHIAVIRTNEAIVKLLLEAGAKVDAIDSTKDELLNDPALYLASANIASNQRIVELLVSQGADVNKPNRFGDTPLFAAASNDQPTTLKYLIAHGANIEARNHNGQTPLLDAAFWSKGSENIKILLAAGADINARDKDRATALHLAVFRNRVAVVELLVASNATVNAKMARGYTPLSLALRENRTNCAAILRAHGAKK